MERNWNSSYPYFGKHEFINFQPAFAYPIIIVLGLGSVAGTVGNILILVSVATRKSLRNVESIFIVNLACADLYVTTVADPMSIIAKIEGPDFFDQIPGLCRAVGSLCTISCVTSLVTIATMSCNRYVFIVHNRYYKTIFQRRNCIIMCVCFYGVGTTLVLMNLADIGDHSFDHKSLECIWDRMINFSYSVFFAVVMVWLPTLVVGASYLHMYLHVRSVRGKVQSKSDGGAKGGKEPSYKLAKTLFMIYCVFSTCWVPYAMLLVFDFRDQVNHEVFVFLVTLAHMHPSINWIVYFYSNRKFHDAFIEILHLDTCMGRKSRRIGNHSTTHAPEGGNGDKTALSTVSGTVMTKAA